MVLRELATDYRFGPFLLEPQRRLLTLDGVPVALSSRAFDILLLLIEKRDRVVGKDEIFAAVWPGTIVEENNLAVQISALRRALGEQPGDPKFIVTVPGRGYRFVAPVEEPFDTVVAPGPLLVSEPIPQVSPPRPPPARRRSLWFAGAACAIALAAVGVRVVWRPASVAPRLSIAVLPFRNLSADPQQDYLADAISDDLTTDLSHIPGSVVIARESSDTYKGRAAPSPDIGRALNVRYLLEGSLRVEADIFHVNAQLIDAPTGGHLWADRFDVTRDKLGAAQEQIVQHIANALNFTLVQVEAARSLHERPNNPDAVDCYLRARSMLDQATTLPALVDAQHLLEKAVAAEPTFSDALAELGLLLLQKIGDFDDPDEWRDHATAKTLIDKALTLAPRSAVAITAHGMLAWEDGRCDQAQPSFRLALSLDPSNLRALRGLARCSRELGQMQDMIGEISDILRIDPSSPATAARQHNIGMGYLMLGQPQQAIDWFNRAGAALADANGFETTLGWQEWRWIYLIAATELVGDKAGASALYAEYVKHWPRRTVWQLASYDTHALSLLPGNAAYLGALRAAGMPAFIDENQDFGVAPALQPQSGSDFDPTPLSVPGATRIDTPGLHALLSNAPKPVIVDIGHGVAVPPGATWVWAHGLQGDLGNAMTDSGAAGDAMQGRPLVIMGDGPLGWRGYNAALYLVAKHFPRVLWYRGGEQSWAAAHYASVDRRSP